MNRFTALLLTALVAAILVIAWWGPTHLTVAKGVLESDTELLRKNFTIENFNHEHGIGNGTDTYQLAEDSLFVSLPEIGIGIAQVKRTRDGQLFNALVRLPYQVQKDHRVDLRIIAYQHNNMIHDH